MARISSFVVVSAFALLAVGCGDDKEKAGPSITVATFNAGLADGFVPYARERAPLIMRDLPKEVLDVLCVEEVWTQDDWDDLTDAAKDQWPHTFRRDNEPSEATTCDVGELDALETCVNDKCPDVPVDQLSTCALEECRPEFAPLSKGCTQCLISQIGNSIADIKMTCETGGAGGSTYAYDGSFGTGILSKYEIEDTDSLLFESTANRRSALYAHIEGTPVGDLHVFCTHLTANLTDVPYAGDADSWEDEQATQIDELLKWVDKKAGDSPRIILLGDFNTGPELGDITSELPKNYKKFEKAGLDDFYTTQDDVTCSFCTENPLISDEQEGAGPLIDHVLLKGEGLTGKGAQFMRTPIDITFEDEPVTTAYSDHYGVSAQLTAVEE